MKRSKQLRDVYGNDAMMLIAIGKRLPLSLPRSRLLTITGRVGNEWLLFSGLWFSRPVRSLATLRQTCQISYRTVTGEIVRVQDQIVDVYAANQADFLKLKDGLRFGLIAWSLSMATPLDLLRSSIMAIQLKIDRVLQGSFDLKRWIFCLCFKSIVPLFL